MAIGNPLSGLAISVRSIFSLSPLISTIATVKPTPAKNPYSTATPRFMEESPKRLIICALSITSSATPSTAQLVVISGR